VDELKAPDKPFEISKRAVWEAWEKVKANKGAPGVDGQTIAEFEKDLKNNLFKVWNRMSSGSYFPPPVRAVEIEKAHGGGTRTLGVPTVGDRIAQTVVAEELERKVEPIFHPDSYGYRPRRSALDAVASCRTRCWKTDWVIDLDIRKFLEASSHCSFRSLWWSEEPVLGLWGFDAQAFPASGAEVDRAEPAVLDTLHDGLAGDAVGEGGLQHGQPALRGLVGEQAADGGGEADPPGGAGGELLAADESVAQPPVQGGGRQA